MRKKSIIDKTINIINEDLEQTRINLKKHFINQIEDMTVKAMENAIQKMIQ